MTAVEQDPNETDPGFRLTATAADFPRYFPTYLANGRQSVTSSLRGTDATPAFVLGLMDRTPGDVSRPAVIPSWNEVDYFDGTQWLNASPVTPEAFRGYEQTLDMRGGLLRTAYTWVPTSGARSTAIEVMTFVSQAEPHLAVTELRVRPDFSGPVRLRFSLQPWPAPRQRLALAELSWTELKDLLRDGPATRPVPVPPTGRPPPPGEILTWFDLQAALAAEGRELDLPNPTAPTRAALWYPGEVDVERLSADADRQILGFMGRARHGADVSAAVAIGLPPDLAVSAVRVEQGDGRAALEVDAELAAGRTYAFTKFVSVSRAGWGGGGAEDTARVQAARTGGCAALRQAHRAAWHELWKSDVVIEGDPALQRVVRSDLFYLRQNSQAGPPWAMGACGMNPNYYGHVFWDCDNWVFPALLLLHPERARPLVQFRHRTLAQAVEIARRRGFAGAMFPWESDPETGTEQTPRFAGVNAEREIMLNGNVAIAQWQYYLATGDREWLEACGFPVIAATADFWVSRVNYDAVRDRYEIRHVTSVDEKYTDVNNEAFTNAVAWRNLVIATEAARVLARPADVRWAEIAGKLAPPFSAAERRHLMFDETVPHDRRTWMAGALTFLSYPSLDYPMAEDVRRNNYLYALRKNAELSPEPNQMMLVMLSSHAAQLGDAEAARQWLLHEQGAFLKPPFNLRSETARNNCTHHLATGTGFLQGLLFGFTGLRITEAGLAEQYRPVLPAAWTSLTLRGIAFRGERLDVVVRRTAAGEVRLERRPAA